jgi:type IV secretion system protein VirB9
MKTILYLCLTLCGPLFAGDARVVPYGERDVVQVNSKVRYTTLLVLPKHEQILDFTCGDKEFWIVDGNQNFAYVKPAKEGSETNLNLITAAGNVYSFALREISGSADLAPDLKLFIEPKDESIRETLDANPRFVSAQQIEDFRQQVEIAKSETRQVREASQAALKRETDEFRSQFPAKLQFPFRFKADKKPFEVKAIFHDGTFTYIEANPQETPALYEIKDGKPNLVEFQYREGQYVVAKVLDSGYLAIGKKKLDFLKVE